MNLLKHINFPYATRCEIIIVSKRKINKFIEIQSLKINILTIM